MHSRQLAAILFSDIVSFTVAMEQDEQLALRWLDKNRKLQIPIIKTYNGRIVKEMGDGLLVYFNSVIDSVSAAVNIQNQCHASGEFELRIGIHLGEVLVENEDIFGDGVNIASRIQSLCKPGSIYISDSVYSNISNKKEFDTQFVTEAELKNVSRPVGIFQILTETVLDAPQREDQILLSVERRNSIAVLPFLNLSHDTEQEYFCEGISEEITIALNQLNNLRVISRTAVSALKGKNFDIQEIGKKLGAETLLEGSVRKSKNQLRINTHLVHVEDGSHIWSSKYDRELEDVFVIQEDIANNVATAVRGFLTSQEKEAIKRPETNMETYTYFLKGRQFLHQVSIELAIKMFKESIQLDPAYAPAFAGLADAFCWKYEWFGANPQDLDAAEDFSRTALTLSPNNSESHSSRGYVLSLGKNFEAAELEFNRAIELNPNSYEAYYFYGRFCFS